MKSTRAALGLVLLLPMWAAAQSTDAATQELIQRLMQRIDGLEKRVAELEGAQSAAKPPAPAVTAATVPQTPVPAPTPGPAGAHMQHDQAPAPEVVAEEAEPVYPTLKISGFGDFDFSSTDLHGSNGGFQPETLLGNNSGFSLGQFTLHLSSALTPKVSVFSELTLTGESNEGTGTPPAPAFKATVERFILRYDVNDYFKISVGRYHTPINYWNTAFHHGQWLQTSISRPEMTQFGGSFIPVHFVGVLLEGAAPAGGLNLNYNVGLGNGRSANLSEPGDVGDVNNNRAWLVNLFVKPDALYGLQMGGSVYHDELTPIGALKAHEWIQSGHIVWAKENPEFIAEFANVSHQFQSGATANSQAFYAQVGYRLPWFHKVLKPYYRFEQIHVPLSDVLFNPLVPTFSGSTVGVRYDFANFAAFKLEYRNYLRRELSTTNGIFAQTSFTF